MIPSPVWLVALLVAAAAALLTAPAPERARIVAAAAAAPAPATGVARRWGWLHGWWRRRQGAARGTSTAEAVVELAEAMAAELRAGQPPPAALAAAVDAVPLPVLPATLVAAAHAGGPVADLLDVAATAPGAAGLHAVAACWRVSAQSGAGLARGLEGVVVGLRDECDVVREIHGQLAAPRATGRLLALLPVFGWLMGSMLGAHPVAVLLTTPYGWGCLALGVPLQLTGWWWMERLAASVDPWGR